MSEEKKEFAQLVIRGGEDVPIIHMTWDYSIFKRMKGNREVSAQRSRRIRQSIMDVGLIPAPIVVNEHMEIIDGQGRFDALKQLGLPVYYIVVPGLKLKDCVAMNVNAKPWETIDYIKSYAEDGNQSYVLLLNLIESFDLPMCVAICAATGKMSTNNDMVKRGNVTLSIPQKMAVEKMLTYVERFAPVLKKAGVTNRKDVYMGLCFCYQCEAVDNEHMYKAVSLRADMLRGASGMVPTLARLTEVYNSGRRKNKAYIDTEYRKYVDELYPWYFKKWGSLYES